MEWLNYPVFAITSLICWLCGLILIYSGKNKLAWPGNLLVASGIVILLVFIAALWVDLERPPLKTLGETRLWYSFFLPTLGFLTFLRWRYKWFLAYSLAMAGLFLLINYLHPEAHSKTLMPALQSPWFIPHVIVYIFSYALLAASSLVAVKGLYQVYSGESGTETIRLADNLVYIGFAFLTLGLLFGALWAKTAWGHYWTWDPKETWAFLTWLAYLIYIHFRLFQAYKTRTSLWILSLAFIILLICWFGINYLPAAQSSVHVYGS